MSIGTISANRIHAEQAANAAREARRAQRKLDAIESLRICLLDPEQSPRRLLVLSEAAVALQDDAYSV